MDLRLARTVAAGNALAVDKELLSRNQDAGVFYPGGLQIQDGHLCV